MSLPAYTATTYFNTGSISARSLQTTFGGNSNNVKFSTYRRDADQTNTSPIVPDATENDDISTENNLSALTFRGSVKELSTSQSGSDTNLNIGSTSVWGLNLNKNIIKNLSIGGLITASSSATTAASLSGSAINLRIDISGQIYGQSGSGNGGGALYLNNTTTVSSGNARFINVNVNSNGRIWAAGGAGSAGESGNSGPDLGCYADTYYNVNYYFGDNRDWYQSLADSACAAYIPLNYSSGYALYGNPTDTRTRCRGGGYRSGSTWDSNNRSGYACATNWDLRCIARGNFLVAGGSGGGGGNAGVGRGFSNKGSWSSNYPLNDAEYNSGSTSGGGPNPAGANTCDANGTSSYGNAGTAGNPGGDWGSDGAGGTKGAAISGLLYKIVSGDIGSGHLQRIKGSK
jgi:hypothetical protein